MAESRRSIERATNGLVLALFLAGAILLVYILFQILGDVEKRKVQSGPQSAPTIQSNLPLTSEALTYTAVLRPEIPSGTIAV